VKRHSPPQWGHDRITLELAEIRSPLELRL
jgi:hypothetical protein